MSKSYNTNKSRVHVHDDLNSGFTWLLLSPSPNIYLHLLHPEEALHRHARVLKVLTTDQTDFSPKGTLKYDVTTFPFWVVGSAGRAGRDIKYCK